MQGKGIVKFFLIVMTLVTLVQYALIYPTSRAERKADAYAQAASNNVQDELQKKAVFKMKRAEYLDSISNKLVVDWRPLLSFTYQQLKARQLALGLDLKGGMSIIMQVDLKDFIDIKSEIAKNEQLLGKLGGLIKAKQSKLSSDGFVSRAPANVVQAERDSLTQLEQQLASIENTLVSLRAAASK